jgi:hypothetical protein
MLKKVISLLVFCTLAFQVQATSLKHFNSMLTPAEAKQDIEQ